MTAHQLFLVFEAVGVVNETFLNALEKKPIVGEILRDDGSTRKRENAEGKISRPTLRLQGRHVDIRAQHKKNPHHAKQDKIRVRHAHFGRLPP